MSYIQKLNAGLGAILLNTTPDYFMGLNQDVSEKYLSALDAWVLLFLGFISALLSGMLIALFVYQAKKKYEQKKSSPDQPGEIMFALSLNDLIMSVHWMVTGLFTRHTLLSYDYPPEDSAFCLINAVASFTSGGFILIYNACFSAYLIFAMRNSVKKSRIPHKTFHVFSIGIILGLVAFFGYKKKFGKTPYGTCNLAQNAYTDGSFRMQAYSPILLIVSYMLLSTYALYYVNKHVPEHSRESTTDKKIFMRYYSKYVLSSCVLWGCIGVTYVLLIILENTKKLTSTTQSILTLAGNISKGVSTSVLLYIRLQEPNINKNFQRLKKKVLNMFRSNGIRRSEIEAGLIPDSQKEDSDEEQGSGMLILQLQDSVRFTMISTTILGICRYFNKKEEILEKLPQPQVEYVNESRQSISGKQLQKEVPFWKGALLDMNIKVISPFLFNDIINWEERKIDFGSSLDLEKNQKNIEKAGGADGGRGGEFFFFSHDNSLVIKTLSLEEVQTFQNMISDYHFYLKNNPNSLITRIFGVFLIDFEDRGESISVFVMKNILHGVPKVFVSRTYDLKGSSFDREVLKKNSRALEEKKVLKDLDFLKLEQTVKIQKKDAEDMGYILENDSKFFENFGIMDYSLLIFVIELSPYTNEDVNYWREWYTIDQSVKRVSPMIFQSIENNPAPKFYHISIIDFFQLYNTQKALEKFAKKTVNFNPNLDTSSQSPKEYSKRFIDFCRKILSV